MTAAEAGPGVGAGDGVSEGSGLGRKKGVGERVALAVRGGGGGILRVAVGITEVDGGRPVSEAMTGAVADGVVLGRLAIVRATAVGR